MEAGKSTRSQVTGIKTVVVTGRDKLHAGAGSGDRGDGGTM